MNYSIMGAGKFGINYLSAIWRANSKALYIVNKTNRLREEIYSKVPYIYFTTDINHVLSNVNVKSVIIATPFESHYEICKKCLEAGKNVICEKPFVKTEEQARELFDLAEENGVVLYVNFLYLFDPSVQELVKKIKDGTVILSQSGNYGPFRGSSPLLDYGSHEIALANYLFGFDIKDINIGHLTKGDNKENYLLNIYFGNTIFQSVFGNMFPQKTRGFVLTNDDGQDYTWVHSNADLLTNLLLDFESMVNGKTTEIGSLMKNLAITNVAVLTKLENSFK